MHRQKKCPMIRRFLYVLGGVLFLSVAAQAAKPDRETRQVIVQFKASADEAKVNDKIATYGGRVKKHLHWQGKAKGQGPLVVVESAEPAEQAVAKFANDP